MFAKNEAPATVSKIRNTNQTHLFPLGWPFQFEESNVVDEGGIVESGMDDDVGDVELLVTQGLGGCAHVVLAEPNLQNVADGGDERQAGKKSVNAKEVSQGFKQKKSSHFYPAFQIEHSLFFSIAGGENCYEKRCLKNSPKETTCTWN